MQILWPLSSIPDYRSRGVTEPAFLTGYLCDGCTLSSTSWGKCESWVGGRNTEGI